ncbi:hypothetical protein CEV32_1325 [Brucella rhizosphaerae]|uniref:Uncharacterized protein n=1 Tax=Brucella rhizosphaerae TaxID=571254 RepID=A0A256FAB8_9HYPH|nr:hypothetical protein CEV32_1325 [Brucella rhizosphaerae]
MLMLKQAKREYHAKLRNQLMRLASLQPPRLQQLALPIQILNKKYL